MNGLTHDLRVAFRSLIGAPVFTVTAVLTLALGIGAAAAIGTAANLALMRPLPYPHGERLVHAGHVDADGQSIGNVGFATALDWRTRVRGVRRAGDHPELGPGARRAGRRRTPLGHARELDVPAHARRRPGDRA